RKTFTLRELARIADFLREGRAEEASDIHPASDNEDSLRAAVGRAAALRGSVGPVEDPLDLDVADPFGRSEVAYRRSFDQLIPA
ncbi:hypothetical protein, partial [Staphylococcus aureus]